MPLPIAPRLLALLFATALHPAEGSQELANSSAAEITCQWGCYDSEDEACHSGIDANGCAEIYGHVDWAQLCNCGRGVLVSAEPESGSVNIYFSVPAFVVLFRESLEVMIVLAIILQFLTKVHEQGLIDDAMLRRYRREIYAGAALGFGLCLIIGVGFLLLASMAYSLFEGDSELIFEGLMMLLTSLVLSFLALNFYKMIHTKEGHERKLRQRVMDTVGSSREAQTEQDNGVVSSISFGRKHAFFVLAFTTGLREGLESIIFLVGVVSDLKDLSSLPIPIISALILSRIIGFCFFQGSKRMKVDWFMRGSATLLCFIAAGFACSSMHNFQELGVFGTWSPKRLRDWQNQKVWDATACCNDKTNRFFVLLRALFGWQDQLTPIELFAYLAYWIIAITIGFFLVRRAKRELAGKIKQWRAEDGVEELDAPAEAAPPTDEATI